MSQFQLRNTGQGVPSYSENPCSQSHGEHDKHPKVSLVVPVYNLGRFVIPCLESLVGQSYDNLEIIVVDDGCTDDTPVICRNVLKDDPRAVVLRKTNGGLSSARNYGLARATGEFAMFVDGDDLLDSRAVGHLVSLARETGAKLVTCGYRKTGSAADFADDSEVGEYQVVSGEELLKMMLLLKGESGSACAKLYARELYPLLHFPEGQLFEDFGVEARLFAKIDKACVSGAELYGYVAREGSITTARRYGDAHLKGMEASMDSVREVASQIPSLHDALSCFEAFCSLRVASRLDLEKCADKARAAAYVKHARRRCRFASRSPLASKTWRIRCALFSTSPTLHNIIYRLYGRATGEVIG